MAKTSKKMHIEASAGDAAPKVAPVRTPEEQKLLVTFAMALWQSDNLQRAGGEVAEFKEVRAEYVRQAFQIMKRMKLLRLELRMIAEGDTCSF